MKRRTSANQKEVTWPAKKCPSEKYFSEISRKMQKIFHKMNHCNCSGSRFEVQGFKVMMMRIECFEDIYHKKRFKVQGSKVQRLKTAKKFNLEP
jgi:hypothetical protein